MKNPLFDFISNKALERLDDALADLVQYIAKEIENASLSRSDMEILHKALATKDENTIYVTGETIAENIAIDFSTARIRKVESELFKIRFYTLFLTKQSYFEYCSHVCRLGDALETSSTNLGAYLIRRAAVDYWVNEQLSITVEKDVAQTFGMDEIEMAKYEALGIAKKIIEE